MLLPQIAQAQEEVPAITPTRDAAAIANAIETGEPAFVTAAEFQTIPPSGDPAAVSDVPLTDFPSDPDTFAILSTGDTKLADDPNSATNSTGFNGGASIRGNTDFDVTVLHLTLNVPSEVSGLSTNCLQFDFQFLSEEFPEYKNSAYNDAFIAELDPNPDVTGDEPWTTSGSSISAPDNFAFDEDGNEISINTIGEARVTAGNAEGTTYDGATSALVASTPVGAGTHHLYLSIFDQGDAAFDSAVFLDALRVGHADDGCTPGARRQISGLSIYPTGEQTTTPTGVVKSALGDIPLTGVSQHEEPAPVGTAPFGKAPFGKAPFGKAPFGKAPFGKAPFGKAPFGKAPFGKAPFGKAPFGKAPFGKAPFGKAPLAEYPILRTGGWEGVLAQTCSFTSATPQSVTWQMLWSEVDTCATVPAPLDPGSPQALRLEEILVGSSPLADFPLLAFLMGDANWDGVTRPPATPTSPATWDGELDLIPGCELVDELASIAEGVATGCDLGLTTLANRAIRDLSAANLSATAFWGLTISELNVKQSFLANIPLSAITNQSAVVNCSYWAASGGCSGRTLRDVANTVLETDPPGTAGAWAVDGTGQATGTFQDLGAAITGGTLTDPPTLSDLVIAFLDPTATPIETTPLSEFGFERLGSSNFVTFEVAFGVRCTETAGLQVHASPPPTFTYAPGSTQFSVGNAAFTDLLPEPTGTNELTWDVTATCPAGQIGETPVRVRFDAMAGFELGTFTPDAGAETTTISRVNALAGSRTSVEVVESLEQAGANDSPATAPTVTRNSVAFSHLNGADDVDYFAFDVPVGESLDVSLSHLSRDYQLVLYAPDGSSQTQSLRPSTTPFELPVGVEPQVDPTGTNTGVLPPPALQDIPFFAGSALSGISDFRGIDTEFLSTIGVAGTAGDTTYVAQVSGANGAAGPEPYALTIRSGAPVQLPPTPARTFPNPMPSPSTAPLTVGSNVDTLILYDHSRTVAAYGGTAAADIEAALQRLVTDGANITPAQNAVNAVIVPTDTSAARPKFDLWDATPSSPDLMNDVVRAINDRVDSLKVPGPAPGNNDLAGIRNIVIVGEGDLIPHAAIVDGTADGNEIGFVGETIFGGQSNHLTGAFATKHFLSDAPYGALVPLSLKGQLLYLPQAAVGRLFGGPDEIVGAIDRFLAADGLADPDTATTETRTAFESDYDFFVDGGGVIANALSQQVGAGNFRRLTPTATTTWSRADFAAEVDGSASGASGAPPHILSPNGHFDQYRMLPAAGAATDDESDVYTTADLPSGLAPTILGSLADLNGDGAAGGADDANAFYGDTSIIDGGLDCDQWLSVENAGTAGNGVITTSDTCTLIGYDGTSDGVTINVVAGEFKTADGVPIAGGERLPTVFNAGDPDNPGVPDSDFAWSVIDGRVDANGDGTIDGDDCHVDLVGIADVLGNTATNTNPCGFATPPDPADTGKVDLNGDGVITAVDDTCDGCLLGEDVTNGLINSHLAGRIFFTIGCHFGLNVPDSIAGVTGGHPRLLDWQQALAQRRTAVTIGNFGYGIGDTATVGFQEEILGTFAENLDGSMSVGAGLQDALRDYMASMPSFTPYDLKILQELGTGGLPMYRVPGGGGGASTASVSEPGEYDTGITGVDGRKVTVTSAFDPESAPGSRTFFSNDGEVQTTHPYPIVPKVTGDVPTLDGKVAHGAFPLRWGAVEEVVINAGNGYAFANATYDGSTVDGAPIEDAPAAKVVYPTAFGNVGTWYDTDGTPHHQLVVLSGQFRSNETGDPAFGTFRKYSTGTAGADWVVTYSANETDFLQPRFSQVSVLTTGTIEAAVADEAGVAKVFAQVLSGNSYTRVPLTFDSGDTWRATFAGTIDEVTLFAIDNNGNVGTSNNGGPGFIAVPPVAPDVSIQLAGNEVGGTFVEPVTVTVSPDNYKVKIDGGSVVDDPVVVSSDGSHTATAYEPDGTTPTDVTVNFTIDTSNPTITITTPAGSDPIPIYVLDRPGEYDAPVFTDFSCSDGGAPLTGVQCYDMNGKGPGELLDRSTLGIHTFTVTARDASGHVTTLSHQYRVVKFEGFFDPVNNPETVNTAKAGGIVPVKWRLTDENGVGIAGSYSFVSITARNEGGAACEGNPDAIESFSGSSGLQYLGDGNWQFNWKTLKSYSGKCVVMSLNLYDGQTGSQAGHTAAVAKFKFK